MGRSFQFFKRRGICNIEYAWKIKASNFKRKFYDMKEDNRTIKTTEKIKA